MTARVKLVLQIFLSLAVGIYLIYFDPSRSEYVDSFILFLFLRSLNLISVLGIYCWWLLRLWAHQMQ